mmetsp:Transcript_21584/g.50348  ORF Transcript_21584/g.50348 Transcript_21584/m.50348 type:complete len:201 (+) Transcript_21584:1-603(+)
MHGMTTCIQQHQHCCPKDRYHKGSSLRVVHDATATDLPARSAFALLVRLPDNCLRRHHSLKLVALATLVGFAIDLQIILHVNFEGINRDGQDLVCQLDDALLLPLIVCVGEAGAQDARGVCDIAITITLLNVPTSRVLRFVALLHGSEVMFLAELPRFSEGFTHPLLIVTISWFVRPSPLILTLEFAITIALDATPVGRP